MWITLLKVLVTVAKRRLFPSHSSTMPFPYQNQPLGWLANVSSWKTTAKILNPAQFHHLYKKCGYVQFTEAAETNKLKTNSTKLNCWGYVTDDITLDFSYKTTPLTEFKECICKTSVPLAGIFILHVNGGGRHTLREGGSNFAEGEVMARPQLSKKR